MRSLTLSLILTLSVAGGLASQTEPLAGGRWALGTSLRGTVDIGASTPQTWGVDLAPEVSYFVLPGLAIEGTFRVAHYSYPTGSKQLAAIGPGVTWYLLPRARSVSPFLGAELRYTGYSEAPEDAREASVSGWEWRSRAGVLLRLGSSVGIELGAQYERSRFRMDQSSRLAALPGAKLSPHLGFQFFL